MDISMLGELSEGTIDALCRSLFVSQQYLVGILWEEYTVEALNRRKGSQLSLPNGRCGTLLDVIRLDCGPLRNECRRQRISLPDAVLLVESQGSTHAYPIDAKCSPRYCYSQTHQIEGSSMLRRLKNLARYSALAPTIQERLTRAEIRPGFYIFPDTTTNRMGARNAMFVDERDFRSFSVAFAQKILGTTLLTQRVEGVVSQELESLRRKVDALGRDVADLASARRLLHWSRVYAERQLSAHPERATVFFNSLWQAWSTASAPSQGTEASDLALTRGSFDAFLRRHGVPVAELAKAPRTTRKPGRGAPKPSPLAALWSQTRARYWEMILSALLSLAGTDPTTLAARLPELARTTLQNAFEESVASLATVRPAALAA